MIMFCVIFYIILNEETLGILHVILNNFIVSVLIFLTILHSEWLKLNGVLAILSAKGLKYTARVCSHENFQTIFTILS